MTQLPQPETVQVVSQPSPSTAFPSSQSSPAWTIPSPQLSSRHSASQPSPGTRLPSSQRSQPSSVPSPHAIRYSMTLAPLVSVLVETKKPSPSRRRRFGEVAVRVGGDVLRALGNDGAERARVRVEQQRRADLLRKRSGRPDRLRGQDAGRADGDGRREPLSVGKRARERALERAGCEVEDERRFLAADDRPPAEYRERCAEFARLRVGMAESAEEDACRAIEAPHRAATPGSRRSRRPGSRRQ